MRHSASTFGVPAKIHLPCIMPPAKMNQPDTSGYMDFSLGSETFFVGAYLAPTLLNVHFSQSKGFDCEVLKGGIRSSRESSYSWVCSVAGCSL